MKYEQSHLEFFRTKLPMLRLFVGSTGALLIGIIAQAFGFIVLAHYLGAVAFGHLMVITSVTALAATWCGFSPGEMLRRQVSRDPAQFSAALGHGLIMIFATGLGLTVIAVAGLMLFIPADFAPLDYLKILVLLVTSNVVFGSYLNLTEQIFLARGDFRGANIANSGLGLARAAIPVVACALFGVSDLANWAVWQAALFGGICLVQAGVMWHYSTPKTRPRWGLLAGEVGLGINLSLAGFLVALRANVDVLVLQVVATPQLVGVYGVARRVIGTALVVPGSFDRLIYGKLAEAGKRGPGGTLVLARRYLGYSAGISAMASIGLFIVAPYVPWVFGRDYGEATTFVAALAWSVITTAVQFLAFDALNAAQLHRLTTLISGTSNVVGAGLIVWLGSGYGTFGVIASLYLSDVLRGVALWAALVVLGRRQRQSLPADLAAETAVP